MPAITRCSFCGIDADHARASMLVACPSAAICGDCAVIAAMAVAEAGAKLSAPETAAESD